MLRRKSAIVGEKIVTEMKRIVYYSVSVLVLGGNERMG
jgi:hypothetical protein